MAEAPGRAAQSIAVIVSLCQTLAMLYQKVQLPPLRYIRAFLLISWCCLHQHLRSTAARTSLQSIPSGNSPSARPA